MTRLFRTGLPDHAPDRKGLFMLPTDQVKNPAVGRLSGNFAQGLNIFINKEEGQNDYQQKDDEMFDP